MENNPLWNRRKNEFEIEKFQNPDVWNAVIYVWIWNGIVSHEETVRQLDEMQRMGIRSIYLIPEPKNFRPSSMPSRLEPDYLTKAFFEEYVFAVEEASKRDMALMFYDEGGWPSGGACGKVLMEYPEYAKQSLDSRKVAWKAGTPYRKPVDVIASFDRNGVMVEDGFCPDEEEITEYYIKQSLFERLSWPDFPDLSRKEATEAFIEIGLEPYKAYLKDYFGNRMTAVFTDEPTMPRPIPFDQEKIKLFEELYGYSVLPYLQELAGDRKVSQKGAQARIHWFEMCSKLFCRNYLLPEKKWSNDNGMAYTGHMDLDDVLSGCVRGGNHHIMRALRCMDIPGVDVIWRQIFPAEKPTPYHPVIDVTCKNRFYPRFASSAASQIGSGQSITESAGVYGAGLTFDELRYVLNFQAVRGINLYNLFGVPYSRTGFQMTGEMPFFTEKQACYRDLPVFNQYMERVSYMNALGKSANETALYAPMYDLWAGEDMDWYSDAFHKTGDELEDDRIPFDIFDDDVLEAADEAALHLGCVCMGEACYTTLVIPPCKYMPKQSVEKLEIFISGGGKVYMVCCEDMPDITGATRVSSISGMLCSPLALAGDTRRVRLAVRSLDGGTVFMLHNEKVSEGVCSVLDLKEDKVYYLLDLNNGRVIRPKVEDGQISLRLVSGELAIVLCMDEELPPKDVWKAWDTEESVDFNLDSAYTFRRTDRFVIDEKSFVLERIEEPEYLIALGDWSKITGIGFSGSGIYRTVFEGNLGDGILDLGEVHYTCEAFLNGKSLGVRVMAPYCYEISSELFGEQNVLEIRVSNTPANEYNTTKSFDKWQDWQLTSYWKREKIFHADSMSGGLYGPVRFRKTGKA